MSLLYIYRWLYIGGSRFYLNQQYQTKILSNSSNFRIRGAECHCEERDVVPQDFKLSWNSYIINFFAFKVGGMYLYSPVVVAIELTHGWLKTECHLQQLSGCIQHSWWWPCFCLHQKGQLNFLKKKLQNFFWREEVTESEDSLEKSPGLFFPFFSFFALVDTSLLPLFLTTKTQTTKRQYGRAFVIPATSLLHSVPSTSLFHSRYSLLIWLFNFRGNNPL